MISLQTMLQPIAPHSPATANPRYLSLLQRVLQHSGMAHLEVGVTSSTPGEGVSTVASELAIAAAQSTGRPTLYIDANFARSSSQATFGLERSIGLADILHGAGSQDCVQSTAVEGLSAICAGTRTRCESTLISASALQCLVQGMRKQFEHIVIDAPTTRHANALAIGAALPGMLLVVEAERARSQVVRKARQQLADAGVDVVGVVFNKRRDHVPGWLYRRL